MRKKSCCLFNAWMNISCVLNFQKWSKLNHENFYPWKKCMSCDLQFAAKKGKLTHRGLISCLHRRLKISCINRFSHSECLNFIHSAMVTLIDHLNWQRKKKKKNSLEFHASESSFRKLNFIVNFSDGEKMLNPENAPLTLSSILQHLLRKWPAIPTSCRTSTTARPKRFQISKFGFLFQVIWWSSTLSVQLFLRPVAEQDQESCFQ